MGREPPQGAVMAEDGVLLEKRKHERRDRTAAPRPAAGGRKRAFLGAIQKTGISLIYESSAVSIVCVISIGSAFVMGTNTPVCGDAFVRTFWHWNLCVPIIYTHSLMYYWIFPRLYGV